MNETLLFLALVVPFAAGALCWALGFWGRKASFWVALAGMAGVVAVTAMIFGGAGAEMNWPWFDVGGIGLGLVLKTTRMSALIGLCAALFGLLITLYSARYLRKDIDASRYYAYVMWTIAGSLTALYADHLLLLLIGWEVVTLMLFLLVNVGRTEAAAKGGMKSFVMLGLADCAMLASLAILWATKMTPNLLLSEIPAGGLAVGSAVGYLTYILLLVGALAKAGAMPFHTWVPAAAEGAPCSVMAFLPASLDKLLGIYLLALLSLRMFRIDQVMQVLLLIIGSVTVLGAVMMAMIQHDLKKLLSYHAVSQVGYMVLGIGTGLWIGILGGLFHMMNNAIYKCCLFLTAGAVERRTGTTSLDQLGGLGRVMPVTFFACSVAALSISGVPPFNGFASKWMVYQGLLATDSRLGSLALVAALFGSALTLASFVKVLHSVFTGPMSPRVAAREPREVEASMQAPMLALAALCILFGLWYAFPTERLLEPAMVGWGITAPRPEVQALWRPLPALGLLVLGLIGGVVIYMFGRAFRGRRARTFVGGEVLPSEVVRVSGTGFYATIRRLPIVGPVYTDAERKAFDVYRLGGRYGGTLVQGLRDLHTGVLPLYVSWCLLGLMVLIAFLVQAR